MPSDANDDLKSLDDRLKKARGVPEKADGENNSPPNAAGRAWKMGIELVIAVVIGLALGKAIDDWLGTMPIALLTCLLLGFAAGIKNVIREANAMQKDMEDEISKD